MIETGVHIGHAFLWGSLILSALSGVFLFCRRLSVCSHDDTALREARLMRDRSEATLHTIECLDKLGGHQ